MKQEGHEFPSIFVFLLTLETLILFALGLPLLLLVSFFFSLWWPLFKTQPFKLFVLVELRSHITYSKQYIPKGFSSSKALFGNPLFVRSL
jgi:hypothetical protein